MGTNFKVGDLVRFSQYSSNIVQYGDYDCFGKLVEIRDYVNNKNLYECNVITGYGDLNTKVTMVIKPLFYFERYKFEVKYFDIKTIDINPLSVYKCYIEDHLSHMEEIKNNVIEISRLIYNNQNPKVLRREKINTLLNL